MKLAGRKFGKRKVPERIAHRTRIELGNKNAGPFNGRSVELIGDEARKFSLGTGKTDSKYKANKQNELLHGKKNKKVEQKAGYFREWKLKHAGIRLVEADPLYQ